MTLDDELRDALRAEADQSQPSPDGWERLQERVGSAKGRRTRVWLPVLAAAVVVLAAVGAWQLASDDDLQVQHRRRDIDVDRDHDGGERLDVDRPRHHRGDGPTDRSPGHRRPDDGAARGCGDHHRGRHRRRPARGAGRRDRCRAPGARQPRRSPRRGRRGARSQPRDNGERHARRLDRLLRQLLRAGRRAGLRDPDRRQQGARARQPRPRPGGEPRRPLPRLHRHQRRRGAGPHDRPGAGLHRSRLRRVPSLRRGHLVTRRHQAATTRGSARAPGARTPPRRSSSSR